MHHVGSLYTLYFMNLLYIIEDGMEVFLIYKTHPKQTVRL